MKASALTRHVPLHRRTPLKARPKRLVVEPGRAEWKRVQPGWCDNCGHFSWWLHHHHVYYERLVREAGGDPWAPENGMFLCDLCHMSHHAASHKIPLAKVPDVAIAFTVDLIGEHRAAEFFRRRYGRPL